MVKPKILLVDDEPNILNACNRALRRTGYDISTTVSPEEGLKRLREESYTVVLSDQSMPMMTGTDFLEKVREISPDTIRVILTGLDDVQTTVEAINRASVFRFIKKPWDDGELRSVVQEAVSEFEHLTTSATNRSIRNNPTTESMNPNPESKSENENNKETLKGLKYILIVDDENSMARAIKRMIRAHLGHAELVLASGAEEAWRILMANNFHLIISDWNMPEQSGYEFLCRVRQNDRTRTIPFLMLTASSENSYVMNAVKAGVSDYIVKPFDEKTLISKIQKVLSGN